MTLANYHKYPVPFDAGGRDLANSNVRLPLNMTNPVAALAYGSIVILNTSTGQYDAAVGSDDSPYYQILKMYDIYGNSIDSGYLTTTQLAASQYYFSGRALGNQTWTGTEDADGGAITNERLGGYFDLIMNTITYTTEFVKYPWAKAQANILIDSSSYSATASGKQIHLLGTAPNNNIQYSSTNKRTFVFQWVAPGASM